MSSAIILVIIILVGGILTWGALTGWTFSGLLPKKGCKDGFILENDKCVADPLTISAEKTTQPAVYAGVIYLDRQNVKCDSGGLNQFEFTGENNSYSYKYKCIEDIPGFSLDPVEMTGKVITIGNLSTSYLTKLDVDCKDTPVSQFQLTRPDGGNSNTIAYNYTCATNKVNASTCVDKKSVGLSDVSDHRAILNNQVACDGKGVVTQFKLAKEDGDKGKYYYDYKCCDIF